MLERLTTSGAITLFFAFSTAHAGNAAFETGPEPLEYVRVCDAYGAGFFYIPGTDTCLKIDGYVRYDVAAGDDVYDGSNIGAGDEETWYKRSRAEIRFDVRSETELGTLRSYADTRFQFTDGADNSALLPQAFIELGGFRIGVVDEIFGTWTGDAGEVINDDVINYQSAITNQVSYTFTGGNGFSAIVAAEQGTDSFGNFDFDYLVDDYMPHVLAGAKWKQGWGGVSGVVGYDSVVEDVAIKLRLDVQVTDAISLFAMGGYQSDYSAPTFNPIDGSVTGVKQNWFGTWEGDWAAWAGFSAKISDKASVNGQGAYEEEGTYAFALNVAYEVVSGFTITPEINYTKFDGVRRDIAEFDSGDDDAFGGTIRFQRNF
ncbi:MAG: porin [Phyllobacterium sp.]